MLDVWYEGDYNDYEGALLKSEQEPDDFCVDGEGWKSNGCYFVSTTLYPPRIPKRRLNSMKKMILSVTSDYEVLNSLKLENEFFVDIKDVTESDLNLVKRLKNIHMQDQLLHWHRIAFVNDKFYDEYLKVKNTHFVESKYEYIQTCVSFNIDDNAFCLYRITNSTGEFHCGLSGLNRKLIHRKEICVFEFPQIEFEWQVDVFNLQDSLD